MPSSHATILIGYLPVGRFDCFSEKKKQIMRYQTFHTCMKTILSPLSSAGRDGVPMACADNKTRRVWPILAAYVADYPEQCLVACCMENRCPIGKIPPNLRGSHEPCQHRTREETLDLLKRHEQGKLDGNFAEQFACLGIRPVHRPFWSDLPHANIFQMFTPDLLHQLHKGVFKDHLVKWCTALVGEEEIDTRFKTMPDLSGLRYFKSGISGVSQWTGAEHKEMERVFVGLMAAQADERVVQAVRSLLDFIYLASLHRHTTASLTSMRTALDSFHQNKQAFIDFEARQPAHFNIPKYHMMEHYVDLIRLFGTADGFNTEWSERLHIDYAKDAYRASNKKDYTVQMTRWLRRQEAVDRFTTYLYWCRNGGYKKTEGATSTDSGSGPSAEPGSIDFFRSGKGTRISERQGKRPSITYQVPQNHPARLKGIPASQIISQHRAPGFLTALKQFLRKHHCVLEPQIYNEFTLYSKVGLELLRIPEVSLSKWKDFVCAAPPIPEAGRRKAEPPCLDFALIRTKEVNTHIDRTKLEGEWLQKYV